MLAGPQRLACITNGIGSWDTTSLAFKREDMRIELRGGLSQPVVLVLQVDNTFIGWSVDL